MERENRNSSFELLRLVCIFGIISMHTWAPAATNVTGINEVAIIGVNTVFNTSVSLFVLISGYYGINIVRNPQKVIALWVQVLFCSLLSFLITGVLTSNFIISDLINAALPITRGKYWYASSYILLMVLSPFLNKIGENISRDNYKILLIILFTIFSIIPTVVFHHILDDNGKGPANVIMIYLIGRYIRLYHDDKNNVYRYAFYSLILILLQFIGNLSLTFIWRKFLGQTGIFCPLAYDYSSFIVLASITIFMLFKSLHFHSTIINKLAIGTFSIYLMDKAIRDVLNSFFNIWQNKSSAFFSFYVLGVVIITMLLGSIIDIARRILCPLFSKLVIYFLSIIWKYLRKIVLKF